MARRKLKKRAWWMGRGGNGLRVRLSRVPGETPRKVLHRPIYFPAVMRGFGWTEEFGHTDFETVRSGEFSQPAMGPARARRLRSTEDVETLVMAYNPEWLVSWETNPLELHETLMAIGRSRRAVAMLARLEGSRNALLRMPVTIRAVAPALREGEPDTLYYVVSLKEWRDLGTKRRAGADPFPKTHYLDENDTLHSLSRQYYRTTIGWRTIAERNKIRDWGPKTPIVNSKRFDIADKIIIPEFVQAGEMVGVEEYRGPIGYVQTPAAGLGTLKQDDD